MITPCRTRRFRSKSSEIVVREKMCDDTVEFVWSEGRGNQTNRRRRRGHQQYLSCVVIAAGSRAWFFWTIYCTVLYEREGTATSPTASPNKNNKASLHCPHLSYVQ
jgi:hypothetical protein